MRIVFFLLCAVVVASCSRVFVLHRAHVPRYQVCTSNDDCLSVVIKGDSSLFRVSAYGPVGVRVFEVLVLPDTLNVIYLYDEGLKYLFDRFYGKRMLLLMRRLLVDLTYGFTVSRVVDQSSRADMLEYFYCDDFFCVRLVLNSFSRDKNMVFLKEGFFVFNGQVFPIRRY